MERKGSAREWQGKLGEPRDRSKDSSGRAPSATEGTPLGADKSRWDEVGLFSQHREMGAIEMNAPTVPGLLVFELNEDNDELFVHADPDGLRRLARLLDRLAIAAEGGDFPHEHMFTPDWGGDELSSLPQEKEHHCLNHVKVYGWPSSAGALPYARKADD